MGERMSLEEAKRRQSAASTHRGHDPAHDPKDAQDHIDAAVLLSDVYDFLGRFIAYPSDHARVAHTLWIAHAHLMDSWFTTPRLAFMSAEKESGKTNCAGVIEEAMAEIKVAKANRENMRTMIQREIGESFAKAEAFKRSVELYREGLLSQAELSFRTALAAYQTGRAEFVSLLEARRALREAQMGYYRSLVGLLQNLADLERAVGRELQ